MRPLRIVQILAVTLALATYSHWILPGGSADSVVVGAITVVGPKDAATLWHQPSTLFLDVRTPFEYSVGHIQGAINVPETEFERRLPELKPRLEGAETIIIYCGSTTCAQGLRFTIRLQEQGFKQAKLYARGWNDWFLRGLPIERESGLR